MTEESPALHVFVAHRTEDQAILSEIIRELRGYCDQRVRFYFSKDITPGTDWRQWITDNLATSNQLWLFYTQPQSQYRWPFYEAGIFAGFQLADEQQKHLVCFHPKAIDVPSEISVFQAVKITEETIAEFLTSFFSSSITPTSLPINGTVAGDSEKIKEIASKIFNLLHPHSEDESVKIYNKLIEMRFQYLGQTVSREDLENATLNSVSNLSDIFARDDCPATWSALITNVKEKIERKIDDYGRRVEIEKDEARLNNYKDRLEASKKQLETLRDWTEQVHSALKKATAGDTFSQPDVWFNGVNDANSYLPIVFDMAKRRIAEDKTDARVRLVFVRHGHPGEKD